MHRRELIVPYEHWAFAHVPWLPGVKLGQTSNSSRRKTAAGPSFPTLLRALVRAWQPLLTLELLLSVLTTAVLGPLLFQASYRLIGLADDIPLGNWELAWFWVSPRGLTLLAVGSTLTLVLVLLEYSALIVLIDDELCQAAMPAMQLVWKLLGALGRLAGLAVLHLAAAAAIALPFVALAALTYWLLLSGADINYYLTERPPRFWIAATTGGLLLAGLAAVLTVAFTHWSLTVPECVLNQASWTEAFRASSRRMRGRVWRLACALGIWQALRLACLALAWRALDMGHDWLFSPSDATLTYLLWITVVALIVDAAVIQLLGALFAIGTAAIVVREYECSRSDVAGESPRRPATDILVPAQQHRLWPGKAIILALLIVGPAVGLAFQLASPDELLEQRSVRVTAHRAGPKSAPENSLAALRLALAVGADDVEIDVQRTADGQVVLLHDRDLKRVTGDPRSVHDLTLSELQALRLRADGQPTEEQIPTLSEFLAACGDTLRLNVELKETTRDPQLAPAVVEVLTRSRLLKRAAISCFELEPLAAVRRADSSLPVGVILSAIKGDVTRLPVDFLSLNQRLVRGDLVRRAHERGIEVHAWTVNDRATALRMLDLGCDNLITSDPALMREVVDWYAGLSEFERLLMRLRRWARP